MQVTWKVYQGRHRSVRKDALGRSGDSDEAVSPPLGVIQGLCGDYIGAIYGLCRVMSYKGLSASQGQSGCTD